MLSINHPTLLPRFVTPLRVVISLVGMRKLDDFVPPFTFRYDRAPLIAQFVATVSRATGGVMVARLRHSPAVPSRCCFRC